MQEEIDAINTVSRAVDRIKWYGRFADLELSNGIVIKLKPVPPLLLQAVLREFRTPPPPKVYIEEKGRDEENPNDPHYLQELQDLEAAQTLAVNDLIFGTGTECKFVPDGYFGPEKDEWIQQVEFAAKLTGVTLEIDKDDPVQRYLCWLRFYALETGGDVALVNGIPMQLAGVRESEVDEVIESFRDISSRGTDNQSPPTPIGENGDSANRAARRSSSRNRRT